MGRREGAGGGVCGGGGGVNSFFGAEIPSELSIVKVERGKRKSRGKGDG